MQHTLRPVNVISVCNTEGEIRPLRFQMEDEEQQLIRANIEEAVMIKEIPYVGMEAYIYLCRAKLAGQEIQFELKYTIRSHTWCLLRRLR